VPILFKIFSLFPSSQPPPFTSLILVSLC
jgi:hypothetical protein